MTVGTMGNVVLNTTVVPGISSWSFDPGIIESMAAGNVAVPTQYLAKLGQKPFASFTTKALGIAKTTFGEYLALASTLYLDVLHRTATGQTGVLTTGTRIAINSGAVVLRSVSASHGAFAEATYDVVAASTDGSTAPYAVSSATVGTVETSELFTLGSLALDGVAVTGLQSLEFSPGITMRSWGGSGLLYDTLVAMVNMTPTMQATTWTVDNITTGNVSGGALATTGAVATFQQVTNLGILTGSGNKTATILKGRYKIQVSGSSGDELSTIVSVIGANTTTGTIMSYA